MSAYLSLVNGHTYSSAAGNYHEYIDGFNDKPTEKNMDLWNNSIGREIANEIKKEIGPNYKKYSQEELCDIASEKVMERMKDGDLITTPNDKRSFSKMMYDRLKDKDRIFYLGEISDMSENEKSRYSKYYYDELNAVNGKLPSKEKLMLKTSIGDLIYVNNYVRGDGIKVK